MGRESHLAGAVIMRDITEVAVITGGAGELGLECARKFRHCSILLSDVAELPLERAGHSLRDEGFNVHTFRCDLTSADGAQQLAATAERLGRLRALVHAAGVAPPANPELLLRVNLLGTINVLNAFERLALQDTAAICIASLAGHRRLAAKFDNEVLSANVGRLVALVQSHVPQIDPSRLAYAISKRGVIVQCQARSVRWSAAGARVLSISPGIIGDTSMGAARTRASSQESTAPPDISKHHVAAAVALLSSPDARSVTGCDLLVDGGFLAQVNAQWSQERSEQWHGIR